MPPCGRSLPPRSLLPHRVPCLSSVPARRDRCDGAIPSLAFPVFRGMASCLLGEHVVLLHPSGAAPCHLLLMPALDLVLLRCFSRFVFWICWSRSPLETLLTWIVAMVSLPIGLVRDTTITMQKEFNLQQHQ